MKAIKRGSVLVWVLMFCLVQVLFSQGKGGRWRFENNGADTADWDAAEDDGVLMSGAFIQESSTPVDGNVSLFLDAGQVNACFLVPDGDDLDFEDQDIAISAWVFPSVLNDVHFILSKGDQYKNPKTTNYAVRISSGRNLEFLIRDSKNQARTAASSFTIPLNEWTFLAVYYDYSAGKVYMWNQAGSAAVDTLEFVQPFFPNNDPLCIGAWFTSDPAAPTAKPFKGSVDDVRISGKPEDVLPVRSAANFREAPARGKGDSAMQAFPNPISLSGTGGEIGIRIKRDIAEGATVRLYNILGQEIHRADLPRAVSGQVLRVRLSGTGTPLNAGVYFLRILNGRDTAIQKLLIVH